MGEEKAPKRTMLVVHLGLIIFSSMLWNAVSCHEYRNYPIQVHQMFQERVHHNSMTSDREKGSWGGWAAWSDCSRSCGTGVQSQARECVSTRYTRKRSIVNVDEEKPEVKPFCIGTYKRYHVCNTQECPNFGDPRAEQCAKYNGKFYKGRSYEWEPFPDAPNECALNCRAVGERFYATLEPEVLDGTPCRGISRPRTRTPGVLAVGTADHWLCIAGQCKSVGCDGVVGSGRVLDACGVCGGEGNSCRLFEGIFLEGQLAKGYQLVTTIPKGAVSLNVSELRQSINALALRDSNSSFLLNGNPSLRSPSGVYKGVGTRFTYRRGDVMHVEYIWAEGPLGEPVDLMILSEELNPGILYKYMLPINEKIDDSAMIAPPLLVAGPNDKIGNEIPEESGQLSILPEPKILDRERGGSKSERRKGADKGRKDNYIGITKMAGDQPMQQTQTKEYSRERKKKKNNRKFFWKISGLSPCSKACGGGVKYPTFKCFRENTQAMAPERRCKRVPRPPSPPPLRCNTRPCPARWRAGPWSPCSATCGSGTQTRKLECVQELNPKLTMRVASGACIEKTDLKTTMQCKQAPCIFSRSSEARQIQSQVEPTSSEPKWTTTPWGTCSTTCGSGIRKRQVTCVTSGAATCPSETRPGNETICDDLPECKKGSEPNAPWLYTDWSSQCSAECGTGLKTRQVACDDGNEVFCDADKKPNVEKNCTGNGTDCDRIRYQWFVGAWSPCTVSCGSGLHRRDVVCLASIKGELKINDDKDCGEVTRPIAEERCLRLPCSPEWFTSDWTECTKKCGLGLQTRVVRCLSEGVQSSGCSKATEPKGRKICAKEACKSDSEGPVKPPKKVYEKTDCVDKYPNCNLVVKAGLCRINYYKHSCCSCSG